MASSLPSPPGKLSGWDYRLARVLSFVINPLILPPLAFGLILLHFRASVQETVWVVGVIVMCFGLMPLGYVLWLVRRSQASSIEVPDRRNRTKPLLVGLGAYGLALVVLAATGRTAVDLVVALVACQIVNTLVLLLITLRWKISLHAAALAGFFAVLLFVAYTPWPTLTDTTAHLRVPALLLGLPLLPALMWARVRVEAHTWGQVTAGAGFGLIVPALELWALLQTGVFASL